MRSPARIARRTAAETAPIEARQRQLAQRRLLAAMGRLHRREPLRTDHRVDVVISELRRAPRAAPGHRGSTALTLDDRQLRSIVDDLVATGRLARIGHRIRLPDRAPALDPEMRSRVDRLLAGLREAGATPPRVEGPASRLGIPPSVVAQLRSSGELVTIGPGIDYAREAWEAVRGKVDTLAARGPLTARQVRDRLHTTRRHAEAILARWRAEHRGQRDRLGVQ